MRFSISTTVCLVCSLVLAAVTAVQADVVMNPSFESGVGADADNWLELEIAGGNLGAMAMTDRVNSDANTGDWAMALAVVGADDFGPVAEIQQQTVVGSVTAGTSYDFSFFSKGIAGPGAVAFYEVSWFDGDGSNGGGVQGAATGLQTFDLTADYVGTSVTDLIAPVGADSVFIQLRLVTGAFDGGLGSAFIDDVNFTPSVVPEPASALCLTGIALLAGLRRRR